MQSVWELLEKIENRARKVLHSAGIEDPVIELEPVRDPNLGDLTLGRLIKIVKGRSELCQRAFDALKKLEDLEEISKVEEKNGFVNIWLNWSVISPEFLKGVIENGAKFFSKNIGEGKTIVIDYFSPNVGRVPHFGNFRSAILGCALRNILEFVGYKVIGVNWWGDVGTQFGCLIAAWKMWGDKERLEKEGVQYLAELYKKFNEEKEKNPDLWEIAKEETAKIERGDEENIKLLRLFLKYQIEELRKKWYPLLKLKYEDERGESHYIIKAKELVKELLDKGIAYVDEDGTVRADLTKYGLDRPVLLKSDGTTLYLTRDLATAIVHWNEYKFYRKIYVVGREQELHFKQLKKILELAGYNFYDRLIHYSFGLLLMKTEEGKVAKFSTRKGRVVLPNEVLQKAVEIIKRKIEEGKRVPKNEIDKTAEIIAVGAIKYFILKYDRKKDIVFEWEKVLSFEGQTGPFIQYAVVRAKSILEKSESLDEIPSVDIIDCERALLSVMLKAYKVIKDASEKLAPDILAQYCFELADIFNTFYHSAPVISEKDEKRRKFRIALVRAFGRLEEDLLNLLGIDVPRRM